MTFRGDIEAERERVASLERDLAVARERRAQDQARIAELHRLTTERHSHLPQPPPKPLSRGRLLLGYVVGSFLLFAWVMSSIGESCSPPSKRDQTHMLVAEVSLQKELAPEMQVQVLEADQVPESGEIELGYGQLRARVRSPRGCEILEWQNGDRGIEVRRYPFKCLAEPAPPPRCKLADIRKRSGIAGNARVHYQSGSWEVYAPSGGKNVHIESKTLADDCP